MNTRSQLLTAVATVLLVTISVDSHAQGQAVMTVKSAWESTTRNILRAAEQVPEDQYGYRPSPDVRSFGEMIGHLAGAQDLFCGAVLGEETAGEDAVESSTTTKEGLIAAFQASNKRCSRAYALSDTEAGRMVTLFGNEQTALAALLGNAMHDESHYGNLVTYMRILEMVPPSSQGQ